MLSYNEITVGKNINMGGEPYEVVSSQVSRKQANKPVNKTKVKNLISGRVTEKVFHVSDKAIEADVEILKIKYLYQSRGEYWFCKENDPSKRFKLESDVVKNIDKYIKENSLVDSIIFDEKIIGVNIPIKVSLKVNEAPPAVKGNTATGATKQVTLETGLVVNTPLFINEGDIISINTETNEYAERNEKG